MSGSKIYEFLNIQSLEIKKKMKKKVAQKIYICGAILK